MEILKEAESIDSPTLETIKINALLAGESGAGKKTGAFTLLNSSDTRPGLLIDTDHRGEALAGSSGVLRIPCWEEDPKNPQAWERIDSVRKELLALSRKSKREDKPFPYQLIVVGSITGLGSSAMNWALLLDSKRGLGGCPAMQHYGPQMWNLMKWIQSMLSLPCHVVMTCHEDLIEGEGGSGIAKFLPKITGKLRTDLPKWFNETYYCYREAKTITTGGKATINYKFFWQTQGTGKREYLKSSLNRLGSYWSDPISIDFSSPPVGFQHLLAKRFKDKEVKTNER